MIPPRLVLATWCSHAFRFRGLAPLPQVARLRVQSSCRLGGGQSSLPRSRTCSAECDMVARIQSYSGRERSHSIPRRTEGMVERRTSRGKVPLLQPPGAPHPSCFRTPSIELGSSNHFDCSGRRVAGRPPAPQPAQGRVAWIFSRMREGTKRERAPPCEGSV